jgi:VanZ family protein
MKNFIKAIPVGVLSALAILLVAYLSLDPDPLGEHELQFFAGADKVAHFLMYLVTTCIFIFDYAKFRLPHHTKLNLELLFMCCAMLLGLLMEIGQLAISNGRVYDAVDLVANCLGAAIGFCYMHWRGLHKMRHWLLRSGRHRSHRN